MCEIRGLSLFANVGIAEARFKEIGVKILVANELVPKRAAFYQEVYPDTDMVCGDITDSKVMNSIIEKSLAANINFIMATPPCQGMSEAGVSHSNMDERLAKNDARNFLIYYAIEIIKKVKPLYVMLENVPQQLKTKIKVNNEEILIPDYIKNELGELYNFNDNSLIMAKDYGVPQLRERNIHLMTRKDTGIRWDFPAKEKEISLQVAIGSLPPLDPMLREGIKLTHEKFPNFEEKRKQGAAISKWHKPPTHPWRQVEWMMHTPTGKSAIYNDVFYPQKKDGSRIVAHHNNYRRMKWENPSRTITMFNNYISTICSVHPGRPYTHNDEILYSDPRVLSTYELLIVMSIPLDWPIPNWVDDSFLRLVIGEGIPSLLAQKILKSLISAIKEHQVEKCNEQK